MLCIIVGFIENSLISSQEVAKSLKTEKEFVNKLENNQVIINCFYKVPQSENNENTIILKGVSEGEFVEIQIKGSIKNFEHVKLEMKDSGNSYETDILHIFENLSNETVIINSYLPTGIPCEKIKWKSLSGKSYEFVFV